VAPLENYGATRYGGHGRQPSPKEALRQLQEGNARFVAGRPQGCSHTPQERALLAGGQSPLAVVLACSDSRVPPELIFDRTLGELFVIRLAGHVVGRLALASILFAVENLAVPLAVVLGHQGCVAVEAALAGPGGQEGATAIAPIIQAIRPAVQPLLTERRWEYPGPPPDGRLLDRAIEMNVRSSLDVLSSAPAIEKRVSQGTLELIGARYRLDSGRVEWLS
jgi:carbonic anhydrase